MADYTKCPHCGSKNVRKTVGTYAAKAGKGVAIVGAYIIDGAVQMGTEYAVKGALNLITFGKCQNAINNMHLNTPDPKLREGAKKMQVVNTYVCKDCEHTWDSNF